jgi:hypothetical protein
VSSAVLSAARGGAALATPQAVALAAHGDLPQRAFRRDYYLRFRTGGAARVRLLESTSLSLRFDERRYDALASDSADGAGTKADAGEGFVRIELPVPRRVRQVELSGSLFRIDTGFSEVVSNGVVANGSARIASGITDASIVQTDVVAISAGRPIALHRVDGDAIADEATVSGHTGVTLSDAFVASSFAVHALDSVAFGPGQLDSILVAAFPAGARVGLAALDAQGALVEPPLFFWSEPGEVDDASGRLPLDSPPAAAASLREALQRLLDAALEESAQDNVDVALVIESDAPCAATLTQLVVPYLLVRESFTSPPGGVEKETLRFDGVRKQTQSVSLELPGSVAVHAASVRVEEALGGTELTAFGSDATGDLSLVTGAWLASTHWVAQPLTPPAPIRISAVTLALLPLARNTELAIELRADWRGGAGGAVLAAQKLTLEAAGNGGWHRVTLDEPCVLDARPCWLRVQAARGSAVWLAHAEIELLDDAQAGPDGPVRLVRAGSLSFALSSASAAGANTSAQLALAGVALSPDAAGAGDARSYDLAAALAPLVAGGTAGTTMTFELAFTTSRRGVVTVYPPAIEYEA